VYGGHNLEDGEVELDFKFDRETARTNPLGLSLVALTVNATHASVMLEVKSEIRQPLALSSCFVFLGVQLASLLSLSGNIVPLTLLLRAILAIARMRGSKRKLTGSRFR
jgi:hypothetical protein